jgi:serine/threonine-protein kinase
MSDSITRLEAALADRYQIEREVGQGGMATVYLAKDLKHERLVAIKVLKPELAAVIGAERFLGEIKTTANLQHPHILPLFDSGQVDSFLYFVMPYVEGETLRDKLDREKQLSIDQAVRIATEVAEALDYAHGRGVIHRDIKPANILLHEGRVLVADFGIALAVQQAGGTRLTETGLSVGTPQYMSPEQATGDRELDGRSDLYSLGCVLYEMLAADPPHTGSTAQAIFAKVLTDEPRRLTELRDTVPDHIEAAVHSVLQKLPADRASNGARFAEMVSGQVAPPSSNVPAAASSGYRWRERLVWAAALVAVLLVAMLGRVNDAENPVVKRLTLTLPDSAPMAFIGAAALGNGRRAFAVSDDGSTLVYVGVRDGVARLYVRPIDSFEARELPQTEGAFGPFFSPNGLWIAFFVGNELRKVRVDGGAPLPVALAPNSTGGDWAEDGTIVFATGEGDLLERVSEEGGAVRTVASASSDWGEEYAWPQVLSVTDEVLVSNGEGGIWLVDLATGESREVSEEASEARYLPSGHIVLVRGSAMYAARFDLERGRITGPTVPVLTGLRGEIYGQGQWDVTLDGTLFFATGIAVAENPLTWVSPGRARELLELPTRYRGTFELSPSGDRLAVVEEAQGRAQVWVYDLATGRPQQVTRGEHSQGPLAWSPDGSEILFHEVVTSDRSSSVTVYAQRADGGSGRQLLTDVVGAEGASSWSAGGLLGVRLGDSLAVVDVSGEVTPIPETDASSWGLVISPKGDAVAYTSQRTGEYHNYVQPFPPTGEVRQVSLAGGAEEPRWSTSGDRLFYRNGQRILVVGVQTDPTLSIGAPEVFYEGDFVNVGGRSYDIPSDEERALVIDGGAAATTMLNVVQGWLAEVERLIEEAGGSDAGGG